MCSIDIRILSKVNLILLGKLIHFHTGVIRKSGNPQRAGQMASMIYKIFKCILIDNYISNLGQLIFSASKI